MAMADIINCVLSLAVLLDDFLEHIFTFVILKDSSEIFANIGHYHFLKFEFLV